MAVIPNAPAVFRYTAPPDPERHLYAARLRGKDISDVGPRDAGELFANTIVDLMRKTGMPNGLSAVGYERSDVDELIARTVPRHRVTKLSPRPADAEDLKQLFLDSLIY